MAKTFRSLVMRPRRPQFSLRWLFAGTTIAAVWIGMAVHRAREQQIAVRVITEAGGTVCYDFQENPRGSGSFDSEAHCDWPNWLVTHLGEDFFSNVVDVDLDSRSSAMSEGHSSRVSLLDIARRLPALRKLRSLGIVGGATDDVLRLVGELKSLESLVILYPRRVTDTGIANLSGLRRLKVFTLFDSSVTDKSLETMGGWRELERLDLDGSQISGPGLAHLSALGKLRVLGLGQSRGISDQSILSLADLISLEQLDLSGANLTSAGLAPLKRLQRLHLLNLTDNDRFAEKGMDVLSALTGLEALYLHNTGVTAEGMRRLAPLTKLRSLDLSDNPRVTDAGVNCLSQLTRLEELRLSNTGISSQAVDRLRGLAKLNVLDLSENLAVDARALPRLVTLVSLTEIDLHNTMCMMDGERAARLRSLPGLRYLDLGGTGSDTRAVESALPTCRVVGSLATSFRGLDPRRDYMSLTGEVGMWNIRKITQQAAAHEERIPAPESLPPRSILDRMIALTKASELSSTAASRRPALERFLATPGDSPCGPESLTDDARRLAAQCRSDSVLQRLYSASVDFEFADALNEHLEYLAGIQRDWALTDVELEERSQAAEYLRGCLRDAAEELAEIGGPSAGDSEAAIRRIWTATSPPKCTHGGDEGTSRTVVSGIAKPL